MEKTGERYSTARHFLTDEHLADSTTPPEPAEKPLPPRIADPGMSDEAIQRSTGRTWDQWLRVLDDWGATSKNHTEIARYVSTEHEIGGWWAQNVTVGYERARGMRKVNEHVDGFSVNASRTFSHPIGAVYQAFADPDLRAKWLEPHTYKERTFTENKVWRCEMTGNNSRVEARFTAKSPDKTSVAIEHAKLPAEEDVASWRAFWRERLDRVTALLDGAK